MRSIAIVGAVATAAALAACSGKSGTDAAPNGSRTNTSGTAEATPRTADTGASPAAAVGGPTSTPAAAVDAASATGK